MSDLLKEYIRHMLFEKVIAPPDLGDSLQFQGVKAGGLRYSNLGIDDKKISSYLKNFLGGNIIKLKPGESRSNYINPSSKFYGYYSTSIGKTIVVTPPKSILTNGYIGFLAERAILHAINGGGNFKKALSEDNRLSAARSLPDSDPNKKKLEKFYVELKARALDKVQGLGIVKPAEIPVSTTAKVDIVAPNANIHVKYNDLTRLIGLQDPDRLRPEDYLQFTPGSKKTNAVKKTIQKGPNELENSSSTRLFRLLRNEFVKDLTDPTDKTHKKFGALAKEAGVLPIDLVTQKKLETELLYNNQAIRKNFLNFLESEGYTKKLANDISNFLSDAAEMVEGKNTYFFVFTSEKPSKVDQSNVNPQSIELQARQMNSIKAKKGKAPRVTLERQVEKNTTRLFNVLVDGIPMMDIEFRTHSTGHPPQLHLLRSAERKPYSVR